jgi:hypothetical protein
MVANVVGLARSNAELVSTVGQWDADPWKLNTPAGIVDLRTGELLPSDPLAYCTKSTTVAPAAPGTPAPIWDAFLARIFRHDPELIPYVERVLGYGLTVGLWLSPVIYAPDMIPHAVRDVYQLNPVAGPLLAFRAVLFEEVPFPLTAWLSGLGISFAVLLLGLLAAWAEGRPFGGAGNGWLLAALLLYVPLFALVPLVFVPRGRAFGRVLADATRRGAVTPELARAFRDPVVAAARALELAVVAVILTLMVVKPF